MNGVTCAGEREAGVARTGGGDWRAARRRIGCGVGCEPATFSRIQFIQSMAVAPSEGQELVSLLRPHVRLERHAGRGRRNKLMAPVGRIHASQGKVLSVYVYRCPCSPQPVSPPEAWPGTAQIVPGLARPAPRARAWAVTPARGLARPGTKLAGRPDGCPPTPTTHVIPPIPGPANHPA